MEITTPVSNDNMRFLNLLAESPEAHQTLSGLKQSLGQDVDALISSQLLKPSPPNRSIWVTLDEEEESVDVEWDPEQQCNVYYDRFSGAWEKAPIDDIKRYHLHYDQLLRQISRALNMCSSPEMLVPDRLWDLGNYALGKREIPILFVCQLDGTDTLEAVYSALTHRVGRSDGLMLTSGTHAPLYLQLPGRHQIVPLETCSKKDSSFFRVDKQIIEGLFKVQLTHSVSTKQKFECHANGAKFIVNYDNAPSKEYFFRGKQRQCVEYLYQQWVDGHEIIEVEKMLEALGLDDTRRLTSLFSGKVGWQEIIGTKGKQCWLISD